MLYFTRTYTTQGLGDDLDMLKICKALKKILNCNGCTNIDPDYGEILQLSGRACMMTWYGVLYDMWYVKWCMIVYYRWSANECEGLLGGSRGVSWRSDRHSRRLIRRTIMIMMMKVMPMLIVIIATLLELSWYIYYLLLSLLFKA